MDAQSIGKIFNATTFMYTFKVPDYYVLCFCGPINNGLWIVFIL